MADERLSPAEIESLLSSREPASVRTETRRAAAASSASARSGRPPRGRSMAGRKQPRRVSRECLRALDALHEGFARNSAAALSALVRSTIGVERIGLESSTLQEFVRDRECPTCLNLLQAKPLAGTLILDLSHAIVFPLIDRLLGGGREVSPPARRPLTQIELRLAARITRLLLEELRRAWEPVLPLTLSVERVESDPLLARIAPPDEAVAIVHFELTIGPARGRMSLCIPLSSLDSVAGKLLEPIADTLSADLRIDGPSQAAGTKERRSEAERRGAVVELTACLAETTITARELAELRVGDIITTRHKSSDPAQVAVDGLPKFRAILGQSQGHKAVLVEGLLNEQGEPLTPGR